MLRVLCPPPGDEGLTPAEARLVGRTVRSLTQSELLVYYRRTILDFVNYDYESGEVGRDGRTIRVRPKTDPRQALLAFLQVESELPVPD